MFRLSSLGPSLAFFLILISGAIFPAHAGRTIHHKHSIKGRRGSLSPRALRRKSRLRRNRRTAAALQTQRTPLSNEIALTPVEPFRHLPPLRGSRELLLRQNERATQEGLTSIADEGQLRALLRDGELVSIPMNRGLRVDNRLDSARRYCRPWTARFLLALGTAHYARFHTPLQINSAVRTVDYQRRLLRVNGNAAAISGETRSPHLTGAAIDIGKKGLSLPEIGWVRAYLLPLEQSGKIDVEEEFEQACFHISVYQSFTTGSTGKAAPYGRRRSASLMASRLP